MTKRTLTIATRESPLAICQAELIAAQLQAHHPHLRVELLGITTEADKNLDVKLIELGGKGLFVKELEEALYDKRADIAVHSMKDVPMDLPPGLILPVMSEREDPRDAFISNKYPSLMTMHQGSVLGTSSLRRQTQIKQLRADLRTETLRGNIHTRLKRLDNGDYDGIILAVAGLKRMGLLSRIREYVSADDILPSAGQGALGIECCEDDLTVQALIAPLNHVATFLRVSAERAMCRRLGGGCKVPVAAFAELHKDKLHIRGLVSDAAGKKILRADLRGDSAHAEALGLQVAESLIEQGADKILATFL